MTTRTINTPDPGFSGTRAGVVFRDGVAVVDADNGPALAYFARHGYPVDTPSPTRRGRASTKAAEAGAAEPADPDPED
jgi:hypothetical protein